MPVASSSQAGGGGLSVGAAAAIAGLAGFACMGIELTAVRLLAPFFGDSAYVWTNVIGVILLALALGAFVGGRLTEGTHGSPVARLLLLAAVLTALTPLWARELGGWLLPQELPLDAAMPAMVRGSLAASCLLFAPPIWLLGALSPGLVALAVRSGTPIGRAAGSLSAAGTLGSLAGTFAATHWLVPAFGCRATLWLCAATMVVAALIAHRGRNTAVTAVLVLGSLWLHTGPLRAPGSGHLLVERETRYQYLQVVETDNGLGVRTELKINEGLDSFHSVAIRGSSFTQGCYYDYHAVVPLLAGDGSCPTPCQVLSIGDAAGTFRRIYGAVYPDVRVDAVELDPIAVELGDQLFAGARAPGRVVTDFDGRVFLENSTARWQVIHVDAYSHQVYIPAHLASLEFFRSAYQRLEPGGVIACNVGGLHAEDPVLVAIARTLASVFGEACGLRVPNSRNFLLVARRDGRIDPAVLAGHHAAGSRLSAGDQDLWQATLAKAANTVAWHRWQANADDPVLVDDRPELDRLLHRSYVDGLDKGDLVAMVGNESAAAAEGAAHAALVAGNVVEALLAIRRSAVPSPYLRMLAGDLQWDRRNLRSAIAEYEDGMRLQADGPLAANLRSKHAAVREELAPYESAAAAAVSNLWLALAALLMMVAASFSMLRRG